MSQCPTCEEFFETGDHRCPPVFEVCRDGGIEWRRIYARSYDEAAEKWAEEADSNSAEYEILGGAHTIVLVRELGTEKESRFRVTGESEPVYTAREA